MSLHSYHGFNWWTTPHELRQLADDMEKLWRTSKPGHDLTVATLTGNKEQLKIIVDQEHIKSPGWMK